VNIPFRGSLAVSAAVLVGLGAWLWVRQAPTETGARREREEPSPPGAPQLLYMKGSSLHRMNVQTGKDELVAELPNGDVQAAPSSDRLAYVAGRGGGEDFDVAPEITLMQPDTGRQVDLGAGLAPLWHPEGGRLAYLRPIEARACSGESCSGAVEVVVYEVGSGTRTTLLGPGRWSLLSWAGPLLVVGDQRRPAVTVMAGPDSNRRLELPPSSVWGASPDGGWLVAVHRFEAEFVRFGPSGLGGARVPLSLGGRRLAEGAWSPDSRRVAAVLLQVAGGIPETRLALLSPGSPAPEPVASSRGAIGRPLWSEDGRSLVFAQVTGPGGGRLRARWCPVASGGDCRTLLSWKDDVRLLELD
jgi:WD40 repeat protein